MLEKIKQLFSGFNQVAGLEITLLSDGKSKINYSLLAKENNLIVIKEQVNNISELKELDNYLKADIPVTVVFNGRGIIYRKIKAGDNKDDYELISAVLPNANPADFFIQEFAEEDELFLSVIRKEVVNNYLELFNARKYRVIHISLGPYQAANLISFLKNKNTITVSCHQLVFQEGELQSHTAGVSLPEENLTIGSDTIKGESLLSFASAFTFFVASENIVGLNIEELKEQTDEVKNQAVFKVAGIFLLGFFFVLLAVNYSLYSYYSSANADLASQRYSYKNVVKDIEELEREVKEKEYFLKTAGWFSVPRTSYYADQIALLNPETIKLSEMNINPLNIKSTRKEKQLRFQTDTIYVTGTCANPIVLNPWIKKLKSQDWVNSISNINYQHDNQKNIGVFEIEIRLNDKF